MRGDMESRAKKKSNHCREKFLVVKFEASCGERTAEEKCSKFRGFLISALV